MHFLKFGPLDCCDIPALESVIEFDDSNPVMTRAHLVTVADAINKQRKRPGAGLREMKILRDGVTMEVRDDLLIAMDRRSQTPNPVIVCREGLQMHEAMMTIESALFETELTQPELRLYSYVQL
jgi:hypothetical protein